MLHGRQIWPGPDTKPHHRQSKAKQRMSQHHGNHKHFSPDRHRKHTSQACTHGGQRTSSEWGIRTLRTGEVCSVSTSLQTLKSYSCWFHARHTYYTLAGAIRCYPGVHLYIHISEDPQVRCSILMAPLVRG